MCNQDPKHSINFIIDESDIDGEKKSVENVYNLIFDGLCGVIENTPNEDDESRKQCDQGISQICRGMSILKSIISKED